MESKCSEFEYLKRAFDELNGAACWSVISGVGSGSLITLCFGGRIARKKPLKNRWLTEEERHYEGEYELYVECAWRLENKDAVLCSSTSSNHRGSIRELSLRKLIGCRVRDVEVSSPAADLEIDFGGDLKFRVFADQVNEVDEYSNFVFSSKSQVITVGARSTVKVGPRLSIA